MILSFSTFGQNCCPEPCAFASLGMGFHSSLICRLNYCRGNMWACSGSMRWGPYKLNWPAHWGSTKSYVSILTWSQVKGSPSSGCFGSAQARNRELLFILQCFVHLVSVLGDSFAFSPTCILPSIPPHRPSNRISVFIGKYPQMSKYPWIITRTALTLLTSQFSMLTCVASW